MSVTSQPPLPQRSVPAHLRQIGLLAGIAAGAGVFYGVKESHALAFLGAVVLWYVVAVGVREVLTQPHPRAWAFYVATVPGAAAIATAIAYILLDDPLAAAVIGLAATPLIQWLVAHAFLRHVVRDKEIALRRRAGLE